MMHSNQIDIDLEIVSDLMNNEFSQYKSLKVNQLYTSATMSAIFSI
jgi:hypothetical protein